MMFNLSMQWLVVAVDVSLKAVLLAGAAALVLRLPRLRDSNLRHRAWTGVLIGMLLLPALSRTVPALQLPLVIPGAWQITEWDISPPAMKTPSQAILVAPPVPLDIPPTTLADEVTNGPLAYARGDGELWSGAGSLSLADRELGAARSPGEPVPAMTLNTAAGVSEQLVEQPEAASIIPPAPVVRPLWSRWPMALLGLWLAGVGLMALRLMIGVAYALRLTWCSAAITTDELTELGVDPQLLPGETRPAPIGDCPLIRVPLALGILRPRILLPSDWPTWPADKLHAVIAHERTHIQRADGAVIFLAELNRCLYWFHPLAWWLRTHLGQLAETACDDAAIDSTGDRATYARHLLEVAAAVSGQKTRLISAGISMARPSHVETRINAILDFTRPLSKRLTWTTTLLLLGTIIPLITLAAAVRPSTETKRQSPVEEVASDDDTAAVDGSTADSDPINDPDTNRDEAPIAVDPQPSEEPSTVLQTDRASSGELPSQTFTYAGTVVDEQGQPIPDAEISWLATSSETNENGLRETVVTHSDSEGHFQFARESNARGEVDKSYQSPLHAKLVAKKEGYGFAIKVAPYFETSGALADSLEEERSKLSTRIREWLEKNDGPPTNVLTLIPDDVPIRGEVLNTEGRPIAGALVQAIEIWESLDGSLDNFEQTARKSGIHDYAATNELRALARGISRSGRRVRYVSPGTSDADGRFTLNGLGRERVADLLITGDGIESTIVQVRSRAGEKIEFETDSASFRRDNSNYPADFTCIVGPSVPVVGRVLDSKTGAPLANMSVEGERFKPSDGQPLFLMMYGIRDTTNDEGEYRLEGLPLGNSEIEVESPAGVAYLPGKVDVTTVADSDAVTCDIEVAKGVIASGLINDVRTGQPLAGQLTYFALSRNPYLDAARSFRNAGAPRHWVDETGRYEIPVLPGEGILAFMASNADEFVRGSGAEEIDVPRAGDADDKFIRFNTRPYICSAANFNFLAPLDVNPDEKSITVDLKLSSGLRVRGRVLTPEGEPLSNFCIWGAQDYSTWSWPPISGDEFEVSGYLPHKPRRLLFYHPATNLVGEHVLRGKPPEMRDVTLQPGATITGRVIDADGVPLPGLTIGRSHHDSHTRGQQAFEEQRQYGFVMLRSEIGQVRTDAEGRFEFGGIIPGLKYAAGVSRNNRLLGSIFHDVAVEAGEIKDLGDVRPTPHDHASTPKDPENETTRGNHSSAEKHENSAESPSYSGHVTTPEGEPIAGAKVWLAMASYEEDGAGLRHALGTADEQGRFQVVLDAVTAQEIRKRLHFSQTQLVATAEGRGLDWLPLDVFEDNPAPSAKRDTLQSRIDQSLGDGRFASRALKLPPVSQPVRGRLVDLEGHPLPNVTVLVEGLRQPDITRMLKAFEMSWKRELNEAFSATSFGSGLLARSELQRLIPPVTTDENGEFELRGLGDDQLFKLVFKADRVEARPLYVLGREMETVSLPNDDSKPAGAKVVFMGRDFTYAIGPSVPVEGVVTDYDSGEPVAGVLVYVERLFQHSEQLRLDTHHMRAVTDRQGRFRIIGMPPGEGHVLEVIPPKSEPYLMISQDVSLSLEDGDAKRIEFQVKRGIWIEGRVTDKQSGQPLSATVDYFALKENPHALDKLGLNKAWNEYEQRYVTDSDGHYRTLGLPGPGILLVKTQIPGYPLAAGAETIDGYDASSGVIHTASFHLRVKDWHLLKQIDPATDAISFPCDLVLDAGLSIPGRVVGPDGKPIPDLHVLGQTERFEYWRPRHDDNVRMIDRFTVNGYDGKGPRQLFFKNQDETLVGQYRLEGDAPEEIVVTLQPSVRVTGRLIENETDLPAARYFLLCEKCSLFNEEYPTVKFQIHWCFTDDEGRFEIKGLMAGLAYKMNALNESNFANNRNRFTIDLTDASPGDVIELGDVTGKNAQQTMGRLAREDESAVALGGATENNGEHRDRNSPDAERADVFTYTGKVVDPNGKAVSGTTVRIVRTRNPEIYRSRHVSQLLAEVQTDEQGRFECQVSRDQLPIRDDDPNRRDSDWIDLIATKPGFGFAYGRSLGIDPQEPKTAALSWTEHVDRPDGNVLTLVADDVPIRGRLIDADGRPIAGATTTPTDVWTGKDGTLDAWQASADEDDAQFGMATRRFAVARNQLQLAVHDRFAGNAPTFFSPVTTDAEGRFTLRGFGRERFVELIVRASGFETTPLYVRTEPGETVTIRGSRGRAEMDEPVYPADFTRVLGPSIPFVGQVTDQETGEPVAECVLRPYVLPNYYVNEDVRFDSLSTRADEKGHFRMEGLPIGGRTGITLSPARGSRYLAGQTRVNLRAGTESIERDIQLTKGVLVQGRALDQKSGQPVAGHVEYFAFPKNPHFERAKNIGRESDKSRFHTDEEGRFEIPLLPGKGILAFRADDWLAYPLGAGADDIDAPKAQESPPLMFDTRPSRCLPLNFHALLPIDPQPDVADLTVDFSLDSGETLLGTVVDPEGRVLSGYYVNGQKTPGAWWKVEADSFNVLGYFPEQGRRLMFFEPERNLVGVLELSGEQPEALQATLQPGGAITGRIVDETGLPMENLQFDSVQQPHGDGQHGDLLTYLKDKMVTTDENGRFTFTGIIPGLKYSARVSGIRKIPGFSAPAMMGLGTVFSDVTAEAGATNDLGDLKINQ